MCWCYSWLVASCVTFVVHVPPDQVGQAVLAAKSQLLGCAEECMSAVEYRLLIVASLFVVCVHLARAWKTRSPAMMAQDSAGSIAAAGRLPAAHAVGDAQLSKSGRRRGRRGGRKHRAREEASAPQVSIWPGSCSILPANLLCSSECEHTGLCHSDRRDSVKVILPSDALRPGTHIVHKRRCTYLSSILQSTKSHNTHQRVHAGAGEHVRVAQDASAAYTDH